MPRTALKVVTFNALLESNEEIEMILELAAADGSDPYIVFKFIIFLVEDREPSAVPQIYTK